MLQGLNWLRKGVPLAVFAVLRLATAARGQIVNPSFETGDFTNWYTAGNTSVESQATLGEGNTVGYKTPTDGTWAALLQTNNGGDGQSSSNVVSAAALETFLGFAPGGLTSQGYVNGSAIKQTFTALAGSTLKFDANFLTNEATNGNQDAGYAYLFNTTGPNTVLVDQITIGTPATAGTPVDPLDNIFTGNETGYQIGLTFGPADFASSGTYAIAFATYNKNNALVDSGSLIDNLSITPSAVPLPAGVWAGLIGMALSLAVGFRMNRARASVA